MSNALAPGSGEEPLPGAEGPYVMGVLNVTPDSFADGGRYLDTGRAIEHGLDMVREGADVVDVGGEASHPGAVPVALDEELRRVVPVVRALADRVRVSIDTTKPQVARAAVDAGATLVNDVSGALWGVSADLGVGWVAMHRRGDASTMQQLTTYEDVVAEVEAALVGAAARAFGAGVTEVWVDPGIGFAKTSAGNLALLGALPELVAAAAELGASVLVGTSRKRFLGRYGAGARGEGGVGGRPADAAENLVEPEDRIEASIATATWCMAAGARMVRVHDVADTVRAAALVGPRPPLSPVGGVP